MIQEFYSITDRLPISNSLLVVPDGDAPLEEKLNMRHLYDLFKNTNSHGIVSLPFLGLIQFYLEENDHKLIKNAISELYYNLSYMTLSGARDFRFDAISDLAVRLSFLLKHATLGNQKMREIENEVAAQKIKEKTVFEPKIEDSLDDVIEIIASVRRTDCWDHQRNWHKTRNYWHWLYRLTKRIQQSKRRGDNKKKKKKKNEDTIESVIIDDANLFSTFDDFWWEDDMFNDRDSIATVDASKNILNDIKDISENILNNLWPVNNRTEQEVADDQNITIDDRTQQELKDNDYISFESDAEDSDIEEIDTTSALDQNKTSIGRPGPIIKFSTDYNRKIKAANKIKNKYFKKNIGQRNKKNNVLTKWLKTAGYLDTKDQDKLNYILVRPKNKTPKSDGVLLTTEIDSTDFKKENLTTKIKKNKAKKNICFKRKKRDVGRNYSAFR